MRGYRSVEGGGEGGRGRTGGGVDRQDRHKRYKTDGTGCIDDRLYSAILRSLQQTHCARMWFYMSD